MVDGIDSMLKVQKTMHHCSHYASHTRDFVICNEAGEPLSPAIQQSLGKHPLGVWPMILPFYSRTCPVIMNCFGDIDSAFKDYLATHNLKIIGIAYAISARDNGINYYAAIVFGKTESADCICKNLTCPSKSCKQTFDIDFYARALHSAHL